MKNLFFLILSTSCLPTFGQSVNYNTLHTDKDSIIIAGFYAIDGFYEKIVNNAHITVFDADSTTILCDSLPQVYRFRRSEQEEKVLLHYGGVKLPIRHRYVFKVEAQGYNTKWTSYNLKKSWYGKYPNQFFVPSVTLFEELNYDIKDAAVVTASRIKFVMKGDTIEYNAAAFRMSEGSMLDNLVRALPGVTMDENGRIKVNGKFVQNLTVNGRDFFRGDPKIALSNLPAYTVDKIKVFHRRPKDDENQRSEAEKENDPITMDVRLKREYAQGWISNYEVAGGSNLKGGWDEKWMARLFALRYTNHSSLGFYANANNLNESTNPGSKGEWRKTDPSAGEKKTYMAGIDLSLNPKSRKLLFNASVQAIRQETLNQTKYNDERYYKEGNTFTHSRSNNNTTMTDLRWNSKLTYKRQDFSQSVYYTHNKVRGVDQSAQLQANTTASSALDSLYARERYSFQRQSKWGVELGLSPDWGASLKLWENGGRLSYNTKFAYNHTKDENAWSDAISYMHRQEDNFAEKKNAHRPSFNYNYVLGLNYSAPRLIKSNKGRLYFNLSYQYAQNFKSGHQDLVYQTNPLTPSMSDATEWAIDQKNSYHTTRLERQNQVLPRISFSWNKFGLDFTPTLLHQDRRINDYRNAENKSYSDNAFNCNPSASIRLGEIIRGNGKRICLEGSVNNTLPDLNYLLDVRDETDPMTKYYGNSQLKAEREYRAKLALDLQKSNPSWRYYTLQFYYFKYENSISRASIYDRTTGITIFQPQNINGNWKSGLYLGINLDDLPKSVNWHYNFYGEYQRSNEFATTGTLTDANGILTANGFTQEHEMTVSYRIKNVVIRAKADAKWTQMRSEQHVFDKFSYTDFDYGFALAAPLFWGIDFDTDLMAYCRRGYNDASMNTTQWVWNASLSKGLGKRKQWVVKANAFDILHQISNVRRTVNAQGRTETWYNTIPSYATLHIVYRLDVKPKKKNGQ